MKGWHRLIMVTGVCFALAACNDDTLSSVSNKVEHPLPTKVVKRMQAYGMTEQSPIMMRIFKEESVLEVWKAQDSGRYEKIAEYDICKWSGELGPKHAEGDRQAPEGYYTVARHQMNPNSSYYLSFNLGYPNRFDRAHGRTGSNLMVHGACSSAGCYSMTDESVLEIYAFAREAFRGGQQSFQVQAYPFRMTPENMARHRDNENFEFWEMLKVGYDHFELTKTPPKVDICDGQYVFNQVPEDMDAVFRPTAACPKTETPLALQLAYNEYQQDYQDAFEKAIIDEERAEKGLDGTLAALLPRGKQSPAQDAVRSAVLADEAQTPAPLPQPQSQPSAASTDTSVLPAVVPVPSAAEPQGEQLAANEPTNAFPAAPQAVPDDKPFWKLWSRN